MQMMNDCDFLTKYGLRGSLWNGIENMRGVPRISYVECQ